jgi:hypothetical protein
LIPRRQRRVFYYSLGYESKKILKDLDASIANGAALIKHFSQSKLKIALGVGI